MLSVQDDQGRVYTAQGTLNQDSQQLSTGQIAFQLFTRGARYQNILPRDLTLTQSFGCSTATYALSNVTYIDESLFALGSDKNVQFAVTGTLANNTLTLTKLSADNPKPTTYKGTLSNGVVTGRWTL
jgi:hypothetical protein